jgi:hypothetical protein
MKKYADRDYFTRTYHSCEDVESALDELVQMSTVRDSAKWSRSEIIRMLIMRAHRSWVAKSRV